MSTKVITVNKKAKFNYELFDLYEAGIELTGPEIKSIRHGDVSINEAFVLIRHNEVQIINMYVKKYSYANYVHDLDPERNRRLLLHKKEILRLAKSVQMLRFSLVPTKLYWKDNYVKLEFATAKGKKLHDKRQTEKERDQSRKLNKNKY